MRMFDVRCLIVDVINVAGTCFASFGLQKFVFSRPLEQAPGQLDPDQNSHHTQHKHTQTAHE